MSDYFYIEGNMVRCRNPNRQHSQIDEAILASHTLEVLGMNPEDIGLTEVEYAPVRAAVEARVGETKRLMKCR